MSGLHSVSHFVDEMMQRDFIRTRAGVGVPREVIPSFRVEDAEDHDPGLLTKLPAEPFILFVGAFRPNKGVDVLLRAYEQLDAPPALVLVGTRERDTPSIPAGVVTLDGLPHRAVLSAWERSLFGVMPSRWPEPFGSVVHEAMSRGRAVIGTRPGGHGDMIEDGETGLLVPSGDVPALRQAMQRLIDDPAYRDRLGARAAERAHDFTAERVVPRFEALYRQLAREH
jgi:glycosyltransferase involved in cell wall biosynthesis